jgi:O-antigen/teichoic acid export membrane protein
MSGDRLPKPPERPHALASTSPPPGAAAASPGPGAIKHDLTVAFLNVLKLGGSLIATWTVSLMIKFQIPRHLGPERFGALNFSDNFAGTFFVLLDLGVDVYIMREVSVRPKHASDFFGGVLALRVALSVALLIAMASTLRLTHRSAEIQGAALVFGVALLATNMNNTLAALLHASTRVGQLALSNVLAKAVWGAGLLVVVHHQTSLFVLVVPMLLAEMCRTAMLVPIVRRTLDLQYRVDVKAVKEVIIRSLPIFMNSAALNLGGRVNVTILEFISAPRELGWFSAVQQLSSLAMLLSPIVIWVLTPLMSRAKARSDDEVFAILRHVIEGIVVAIVPLTLLLGLGADLWIRLALKEPFVPATLSMRILSPVFVLTYLSMILAISLMVLDRPWSLTMISAISALLAPVLVFFLVPLGHRWFGTGGQAAGAAAAVILCESCVVVMCFYKVGVRAVDRRSVVVIGKTLGAAVAVILLDHFERGIGNVRLVLDMVAYAAIVLATRALRIGDMIAAVKTILLSRRASLTSRP